MQTTNTLRPEVAKTLPGYPGLPRRMAYALAEMRHWIELAQKFPGKAQFKLNARRARERVRWARVEAGA